MQPTNSIFICVSEANEEEEQRVPLAPVQQNGPPRPGLVSRDVEYSEEDRQSVRLLDSWSKSSFHRFRKASLQENKNEYFSHTKYYSNQEHQGGDVDFQQKHPSQTIPCQSSNLERPSIKLCQTCIIVKKLFMLWYCFFTQTILFIHIYILQTNWI